MIKNPEKKFYRKSPGRRLIKILRSYENMVSGRTCNFDHIALTDFFHIKSSY